MEHVAHVIADVEHTARVVADVIADVEHVARVVAHA